MYIYGYCVYRLIVWRVVEVFWFRIKRRGVLYWMCCGFGVVGDGWGGYGVGGWFWREGCVVLE